MNFTSIKKTEDKILSKELWSSCRENMNFMLIKIITVYPCILQSFFRLITTIKCTQTTYDHITQHATNITTYKYTTRQNTVVWSQPKDLTRNFHWLDLRLLLFLFRYSDSKHPIFHTSLYLIYFSILGKPEPPHELPGASFNAVPSIIFLFLLSASLSTNLQHLPIFHFHLHFLLLQPGKVHAEHVSLRRLLPVHTSVGHGTAFITRGSEVGESSWKGKALKRVPYIERERVEDVASFTTEETRDERHLYRYLELFWFWWKLVSESVSKMIFPWNQLFLMLREKCESFI